MCAVFAAKSDRSDPEVMFQKLFLGCGVIPQNCLFLELNFIIVANLEHASRL